MAVLRGHGSYRGQFKGAIDGGNIWWTVPAYKIARKPDGVWPALKRACQHAIATGHASKNEIDMTITLPGGGSVSVVTTEDPDSLRGSGLDGVVFDEAAFQAERSWTQVVRPALADKEGWAMFISTPNGFNWFHGLFQAGKSREGWESWQNPTGENPMVSEAELKEIRATILPQEVEQEFDAQFTRTEGTEFNPEYFGEWMWFDEWPARALTGWRVSTLDAAVDEGRKNDYSAIVNMAVDEQGTCWVDADLRKRDAMQSVEDLVSWALAFKTHMAGIEAVSFQKVLSVIFREKYSAQATIPIPVRPITHDPRVKKQSRIRMTLTPMLSARRFRFKRGPGTLKLIEQLKNFPLCANDDGPDALEMAVNLARHVLDWGLDDEQSGVPERVYT